MADDSEKIAYGYFLARRFALECLTSAIRIIRFACFVVTAAGYRSISNNRTVAPSPLIFPRKSRHVEGALR